MLAPLPRPRWQRARGGAAPLLVRSVQCPTPQRGCSALCGSSGLGTGAGSEGRQRRRLRLRGGDGHAPLSYFGRFSCGGARSAPRFARAAAARSPLFVYLLAARRSSSPRRRHPQANGVPVGLFCVKNTSPPCLCERCFSVRESELHGESSSKTGQNPAGFQNGSGLAMEKWSAREHESPFPLCARASGAKEGSSVRHGRVLCEHLPHVQGRALLRGHRPARPRAVGGKPFIIWRTGEICALGALQCRRGCGLGPRAAGGGLAQPALSVVHPESSGAPIAQTEASQYPGTPVSRHPCVARLEKLFPRITNEGGSAEQLSGEHIPAFLQMLLPAVPPPLQSAWRKSRGLQHPRGTRAKGGRGRRGAQNRAARSRGLRTRPGAVPFHAGPRGACWLAPLSAAGAVRVGRRPPCRGQACAAEKHLLG